MVKDLDHVFLTWMNLAFFLKYKFCFLRSLLTIKFMVYIFNFSPANECFIWESSLIFLISMNMIGGPLGLLKYFLGQMKFRISWI